MECCANWFVCCQLPTNMIWPNWFQWSAIIPWHLWAIYKIDFVKEHILLLLFSQHQGLNRSIRLPRCNALWPQNEQSWDVSFTPKCPDIPIHNKSSQESVGTHPKHVFFENLEHMPCNHAWSGMLHACFWMIFQISICCPSTQLLPAPVWPKTKLSGRNSWPNGPARTLSIVPGTEKWLMVGRLYRVQPSNHDNCFEWPERIQRYDQCSHCLHGPHCLVPDPSALHVAHNVHQLLRWSIH